MGHESPIEPWLAPDNRAACGLRTDWLRRAESDENRWQEKTKSAACMKQRPENTERKARTILAHTGNFGLDSQKKIGRGKGLFFYC